jgi:hypothetical protein
MEHDYTIVFNSYDISRLKQSAFDWISCSDNESRDQQPKFEIDIAQILQGHQPKPKRASYRKLDERISRLVLPYNQSQGKQYLENISPNISL